MPTFNPRLLTALCLLTAGLVQAQGPAPTAQVQSTRVEVATELDRLSRELDFDVRGLEQTQGATAHSGGETIIERLHLLLEDFDHVIVQTPDAGIERVIILGEKAAYVPPPMVVEGGESPETAPASGDEIVLATQRRGAAHLVTLGLESASGGASIQEVMLIDTGADHVVLPVSLISTLGLSPDTLQQQLVQTANGAIEARIGRVPAIWVGPKRVEDVEVAFIDDQRLGGTSLLGMSLLGRFRMTIDDERNRLTLAPK
ncbi:MAG: retropepsin-like aspartic protease family protein [Thermochromatium sp.]